MFWSKPCSNENDKAVDNYFDVHSHARDKYLAVDLIDSKAGLQTKKNIFHSFLPPPGFESTTLDHESPPLPSEPSNLFC